MKLPKNIVISDDKVVRYLLAPRNWDDKSKFLAQAGFSRSNPDALKRALKVLAENSEAMEDGINEYGVFFRTDDVLAGPNGRQLAVTVIWLRRHIDEHFHFVTLKPRREKSG